MLRGLTREQFQRYRLTYPQRVMTLQEMAITAAFMASDSASGVNGNQYQSDNGQSRRLNFCAGHRQRLPTDAFVHGSPCVGDFTVLERTIAAAPVDGVG